MADQMADHQPEENHVPRRQYGSGSIYQRADGKWVGTVDVGWTPTGNRRRVSVVAKTQREAKTKLRDKQRTIHAEGIEVATQKLTVKQWADKWMPLYAARVRTTTATTTKGHVDKWIIPTIGTTQLARLTPAHARKIENEVIRAGRSPATARGADSALRVMLTDARAEGHKVPEAILATRRPQLLEDDREDIPLDVALDLLRKAHEIGPMELARWVLGFLGLRQDEALGLTWDRVDFDAGTVDVSWQLAEIPASKTLPAHYRQQHLTGSYYLIDLKTRSGRRLLHIAPVFMGALKAWHDVAPQNEWGLVLTTTDNRRGRGGTLLPRREATDRKAWHALQDSIEARHPAGRRWKIHEMRHTTASALVSAGVDTASVAAYLGQSKLVESYVHTGMTATEAPAAQIGALLDWTKEKAEDEGKATTA